MDWASIVTNVGFPIAVAMGLAWFTKDRLDKSEIQWKERLESLEKAWAAREADWKSEKRELIAQVIAYRDKFEGKLTTIASDSKEAIERSTYMMQEILRVRKEPKRIT